MRLACTGGTPWCADVGGAGIMSGILPPCSLSLSFWPARQAVTRIPGTACDRRVGTCGGKGKVGLVLPSKIASQEWLTCLKF